MTCISRRKNPTKGIGSFKLRIIIDETLNGGKITKK